MSGPWSSRWEQPGMWTLWREGEPGPCGAVSFDAHVAVAQAAVAMFIDDLNHVDIDLRASAAAPEDRPYVRRGWDSHAAYREQVTACQLHRAELPPADVLRSQYTDMFGSPDLILTPIEMALWQRYLDGMIAARQVA